MIRVLRWLLGSGRGGQEPPADPREQERREREHRHVRWQTWIGLAALVATIGFGVYQFWPDPPRIRFSEPTAAIVGSTLVVDGRVHGLREGEEAYLRGREGGGSRDIPVRLDGDDHFFVQFVDPSRYQDLRVAARTSDGTVVDGPAVDLAEPPGDQPLEATVDVEVSNLVVVDEDSMREDDKPAHLTRSPDCVTEECLLPGTGYATGDIIAAVCQVNGRSITNAFEDMPNPDTYDSVLWYGVETDDGRLGYESEVWIAADDRGGKGLPACPQLPTSARQAD